MGGGVKEELLKMIADSKELRSKARREYKAKIMWNYIAKNAAKAARGSKIDRKFS